MCSYHVSGWRDARTQADALAMALSEQGFVTNVYKTGGHLNHPCIEVACGRWQLVDTTEYVYVVPGDDGQWWFWWFRDWTPERIAPAEEVSKAAGIVARELAAIPNAGVRVV